MAPLDNGRRYPRNLAGAARSITNDRAQLGNRFLASLGMTMCRRDSLHAGEFAEALHFGAVRAPSHKISRDKER